MNAEHLESLLLDRSLGELSPAVTALLEEHLARDPAAARRAAELHTTVSLARQVVAAPLGAPPPALAVERLRRELAAPSATFTPARRTELYRLAACLALGLGLGWLLSPTSSLPPAGPAASSPSLATTAPAEPRSTFWSVARLTASQRNGAASTTTRPPRH